jgi:ABC-type polysaccharide/polyol phosphate export permease
VACIITLYRALILPGVGFPWGATAVIGWTWPALLLAGAYAFFQRSQRHFADML